MHTRTTWSLLLSEGWKIHNQKNRLTRSWPVTQLQTHSFCGLGLSLRESFFFYPRLALRDEPSTTRKNWLTLLAKYTHNIFGQHVAILRDARLACLGLLGGSKAGDGRSTTRIHSHTFAHKKPMGRLASVGQAKRKLWETKLRDSKFHSFLSDADLAKAKLRRTPPRM